MKSVYPVIAQEMVLLQNIIDNMIKTVGFLIRLLVSVVLVASVKAATIPITSGYDLPASTAMASTATNDLYTALRLKGFLQVSNVAADTSWFVPEQFFVPGFTNIIISANLLSSNGIATGHSYAYYLRCLLYTNLPGTTSSPLGTNTFTPYYDTGNLIVVGNFRNGTNITYISATNGVSTNLFGQTNLAFGVILVTHNVVGGSIGSHWLLNARVVITR